MEEIQLLNAACFSADEDRVRSILSGTNCNDYLSSSSGYLLLQSMLKNSIFSSERNEQLGVTHIMYERHLSKFFAISKILLQHNVKVNDVTEKLDDTPLHLAVKTENEEIVRILLSKGAIINAVNNDHNTPLHLAAFNDSEIMIQLLLENGADMEIRNKLDKTPDDLICCPSVRCILYIHKMKMNLDSGGNIEEKDFNGCTALHKAVENEEYVVVEFLLSRGADVNALTEFGETPLHLASQIHNERLVLLLLQNGSNVNATTNTGDTPLHLVAKYQLPDECCNVIKILIKNGANTAAKNNCNLIPLNYAVKNDAWDDCIILLGKNPNPCDRNLKIAFCLSFLDHNHDSICSYENDDNDNDNDNEITCVISLFVQRKFTINIEDLKNISIPEELYPHSEIQFNDKERTIVQSFLNEEETSADKMTQLFHYKILTSAVKHGFIDIFRNLLTPCCNVNAPLLDHLTLLHYACKYGHVNIVNELLERGANVNVIGGTNRVTPLHLSASEGCNSANITRVLLKKNANIDPCNVNNETPLYVAVNDDNFQCAHLLLQSGANVNCITNYGRSPLHDVFDRISTILAKLLLHYGASDINECNLRSECLEEIEQMKLMKIDKFDVSIFDLLNMPRRRIAFLMRNEKIVNFIDSVDFEVLFPSFADKLNVCVTRGKLEKQLIKLSYDCFNTILKHRLPIEIYDEILSYIDIADLHRFVIASPIEWEKKKTVQFVTSKYIYDAI